MIYLQCVQLLLLTQSDLLEYGISSALVSVPQFTGHLPRNFPGLTSLWISDLFPWSTYLLLKKHYEMKASSSYIAQPSTSWSFSRLCFSLQDSSLTLFSSSFSCPQIDFSLLVALKIVKILPFAALDFANVYPLAKNHQEFSQATTSKKFVLKCSENILFMSLIWGVYL